MQQPKPFTTIDQQLDILESRGVIVDNREEAGKFLLSENYYAVINGYKEAFLDKAKTNESVEVYRKGTLFKEFHVLYNLDRFLKHRTLYMLLNAENRMRTATVYAFCERNQGSEDYLDPACYIDSSGHRSKRHYARNLIRLLSKLQSISSNKHIECVNYYLKKYGSVPLWVMAQEITFGTMSAFYELQKLPVQQAACTHLRRCTGVRITPNNLRRAFKVLSQFRNICAHDDRLYCARVGKNKESSFKDLLELLALVTPREDMAAYADSLIEYIRYLTVNKNNAIAQLGHCVLKTMQIDFELLESYTALDEAPELSASSPLPATNQ